MLNTQWRGSFCFTFSRTFRQVVKGLKDRRKYAAAGGGSLAGVLTPLDGGWRRPGKSTSFRLRCIQLGRRIKSHVAFTKPSVLLSLLSLCFSGLFICLRATFKRRREPRRTYVPLKRDRYISIPILDSLAE